MGERGPQQSSPYREPALRLRLEGYSFGAIAAELGISRQRAQQLLSPSVETRRRVVDGASGRCSSCGILVGTSGHVHHRKARGMEQDDYNDEKNLVLLCLSCHRRAHDMASGT